MICGMTNEQRKTVLLFRSAGEEDTLEKELLQHNFQPFSIPVLAFNYINIDVLAQCLCDWRCFSAVVFTSQRAVEAAELALKQLRDTGRSDEEAGQKYGELKCYVVGSSTSQQAHSCGFTPFGSQCGNAEKLADFITQDLQCSEKPLLNPCGTLKKDTLSKKLNAAEIRLHEIEVYETMKNPDVETEVEKFIKQEGLPEFVVYFSPSGVKYTEDVVTSGLLPLSQLKVLAIGPTTERELTRRSIPVFGTAATPDAAGLIAAIAAEK